MITAGGMPAATSAAWRDEPQRPMPTMAIPGKNGCDLDWLEGGI
jgi:hypothetical protein